MSRKEAAATCQSITSCFLACSLKLYGAIFLIILYAPIVFLVLLAFNNSESFGLPFRGVTLKWFWLVLSTPDMLKTFGNSFLVGILSGGISVALALALALAFRSRHLPFKALLMRMVLLPIIIPSLVSGVVLFLFLASAEIPFGLFSSVLIAHVNWTLPFAFLTLYPRIFGFDASLEEAAIDLGATSWIIFRRIVFPIIRPAVIATFMFSFTLSFDEFVRTMFVLGRDNTVPVYIWGIVIQQAEPYLPAVAVLMMIITTSAALAGQFLSREKARK